MNKEIVYDDWSKLQVPETKTVLRGIELSQQGRLLGVSSGAWHEEITLNH